MNDLKLLTTAIVLVAGVAAAHAQNAAVAPLQGSVVGGYLSIFPQAPLITIHFDGNSEDIAKIAAPHPSTVFNHDGKAFNSFVRSTSADTYNNNGADSAEFDKSRAEYRKSVKSGKWRPFVNGE